MLVVSFCNYKSINDVISVIVNCKQEVMDLELRVEQDYGGYFQGMR